VGDETGWAKWLICHLVYHYHNCALLCNFYISQKLVDKLQQMIVRGSRNLTLCKLAVLCIGSFCANSDAIFTSLFQV